MKEDDAAQILEGSRKSKLNPSTEILAWVELPQGSVDSGRSPELMCAVAVSGTAVAQTMEMAKPSLSEARRDGKPPLS